MENGYFDELNKYMNEIMFAIITSPNLSKLLTYKDVSVYSRETPSNPFELLYKNVYPYGYKPDIQTEVDSYITIEFDDFRPTKGNQFMYGYIVISVFSHESIQKTNYGNRLLLLYDEVHKIMNNRDIGVGTLKLKTGRIITSLKKPYSGHYLVYEIVDFNK